jgi:hypothetical protein
MASPLYYKLIRQDWIHHGRRLVVGLNTLQDRFVEDPHVASGGFYVCTKEQIPIWLSLYNDLAYICVATIPVNAKTLVMPDKVKVSAMILSEPIHIGPFLKSHFPEAEQIEMGLTYPSSIRFLRSKPVMTGILQRNPVRIKDFPMPYRTEDLCLIAVSQNPVLLKHVPLSAQTATLCKMAVQADPSIIDCVKDPYLRMQLGPTTSPWWGTREDRRRLGLEWPAD